MIAFETRCEIAGLLETGLSQAKVAKAVGVSRGTVNNVAHGTHHTRRRTYIVP